MRTILLGTLISGLLWAGSGVDSVCDQAAYLLFNRHLDATYMDSAYSLLSTARQTDPANERCLYLCVPDSRPDG